VHALLALLLVSGQAEPADYDYQLVNPRAIELFERDDKLMRWALMGFDSDHDGYLSIFEADRAAREFKRIADADGDGRVTPEEFRRARDFIVARYAIR
jgi:Ca2+-binding EF-hand superfamily protein